MSKIIHLSVDVRDLALILAGLCLGLGLGAWSTYREPVPCESVEVVEAVQVLELAQGKVARCEYELRANAAALQSAAQVCGRRRR